MRVSLRAAGVPVPWHVIAKDGADLPPAAATMRRIQESLSARLFDVEYEVDAAQELTLEVYLPGPKIRATQALLFTADQPRN